MNYHNMKTIIITNDDDDGGGDDDDNDNIYNLQLTVVTTHNEPVRR